MASLRRWEDPRRPILRHLTSSRSRRASPTQRRSHSSTTSQGPHNRQGQLSTRLRPLKAGTSSRLKLNQRTATLLPRNRRPPATHPPTVPFPR